MNELNDNHGETNFDFDKWVEVYKKNPELFEAMREELIQSTIKQAPIKMQRRLNGLQWQVDTEIKLAKNPLDGCIKIYQMMMDSVYEPNGLLEALSMTKEDIKVSAPNVTKLKEISKIVEPED